MVKLSVVTPTYNRCESLRTTIAGLMNQTFPAESFEHIVVSDGSTDGTEAMVAEMVTSAPFFLRCVTQPNGGPSAARNRGIREAVNDVVVFLDDDVEPVAEFLARHASHHEADPDVAVIGPMSPDPARASQEPVWIAWEHAMLQDIYRLFNPGGRFEGEPPGPMHFYSGNASVSRQHLIASGGFDETYKRQEDVELAVRLERDEGVHFAYDRLADGLHRPSRTFESWLNIPASYGRLDAKRLQEGTLPWNDVQYLASTRNPLTKALTSLSVASPPLAPFITAVLKSTAIVLGQAGSSKAAHSALSALYNSTYSRCLQDELTKSGWRPGQTPKVLTP
ncbi:MAG TPA: glycosyltransferase [Capsulimonadaceae bacterium]